MRLTPSLRLEVADTYSDMSRRAGELFVSELERKPDLIFCASAGGTPTGVYAWLAKQYVLQPRVFSRLHVVQIDEWRGLPPRSPASCAADLAAKLVRPLGISAARFVRFHTNARNAEAECARMARWLANNGPLDICLLGLGLNGHIAMNEPGPGLNPEVHVASLRKSSQNHPMLKRLPNRPRTGFTLGMKDILSSRLVLLVVSGSQKQRVLQRVLNPQVSTGMPASFLWLHPNARVLCDRAAAGLLPQ